MEVSRLGITAMLVGAACLVVMLYNTDGSSDVLLEEKSFNGQHVHDAKTTSKAAKKALGAETTAVKVADSAYHELIRSDPANEKRFKKKLRTKGTKQTKKKTKTKKIKMKKTTKKGLDAGKMLKAMEKEELKAQEKHDARATAAFKALDSQVNGKGADKPIKL